MEFRCQKKTILLSMFSAFVTMCLYSQTENLLFDRGTVINGVKWATRNVGIPGHFASSTIESGLFYLWISTDQPSARKRLLNRDISHATASGANHASQSLHPQD